MSFTTSSDRVDVVGSAFRRLLPFSSATQSVALIGGFLLFIIFRYFLPPSFISTTTPPSPHPHLPPSPPYLPPLRGQGMGKAIEKRKVDRAVKQEVSVALAKEKLSAYAEREKAKMDALLQMAKANKKEGALW